MTNNDNSRPVIVDGKLVGLVVHVDNIENGRKARYVAGYDGFPLAHDPIFTLESRTMTKEEILTAGYAIVALRAMQAK